MKYQLGSNDRGSEVVSNININTVSGVGVSFNSSQYRDTSFTNKSLVENPSPNKYKICFRKTRIVVSTMLHVTIHFFNVIKILT